MKTWKPVPWRHVHKLVNAPGDHPKVGELVTAHDRLYKVMPVRDKCAGCSLKKLRSPMFCNPFPACGGGESPIIFVEQGNDLPKS